MTVKGKMGLSNGDDNYDYVCEWHGDEDHQSLNFAYIVMLEGDSVHISNGYHAEEERPSHVLCGRVPDPNHILVSVKMSLHSFENLQEIDGRIYHPFQYFISQSSEGAPLPLCRLCVYCAREKIRRVRRTE